MTSGGILLGEGFRRYFVCRFPDVSHCLGVLVLERIFNHFVDIQCSALIPGGRLRGASDDPAVGRPVFVWGLSEEARESKTVMSPETCRVCPRCRGRWMRVHGATEGLGRHRDVFLCGWFGRSGSQRSVNETMKHGARGNAIGPC